MKLILTPKYNIDLKNWNINYIKEVNKTYNKVSKGIYL